MLSLSIIIVSNAFSLINRATYLLLKTFVNINVFVFI